ncbi:MAG: type IV pilus modification PilV family protein [Trueperaceae bacterium]
MTKRKGLTIVEVLVALAIVGIAGSLFGYFLTSLQTTRTAREQSSALAYARNYLEGLRAHWQTLEGYQNLSLATPNNPPEHYELKIKIENDEGGTVFAHPGGASSRDLSPLRVITVIFTDKENKTITLQTMVARPTPIPEATDEE